MVAPGQDLNPRVRRTSFLTYLPGRAGEPPELSKLQLLTRNKRDAVSTTWDAVDQRSKVTPGPRSPREWRLSPGSCSSLVLCVCVQVQSLPTVRTCLRGGGNSWDGGGLPRDTAVLEWPEPWEVDSISPLRCLGGRRSKRVGVGRPGCHQGLVLPRSLPV